MKKIAIIGLGTMGPGMAARLARGGVEVTAYDIAPAALERASAMIATANAVLDTLGITATADNPVKLTSNLAEAVADADLVIENVPEKPEIKASVYRQIDALIGPDVIVASDTSGIPITSLQEHISNPARMVGMHWSNPPHIIPMIEVIAGAHTAPETSEAIKDLIRSLGLLPVTVKKDVPGFVENRVLYALLREVIDLVEQGVVDPEDIDTCVSWGIGYKLAVIGPMALLDMAGLDIYQSVSSFLNADLADRKDVPELISKKIAAGTLGLKSGSGVYDYTPEKIAELQKRRAEKLVAIRRILEDRA
ncbi:5-formyl-3-hydroxy-2-methylpyridine 4-carboxylate 5-dehydrogenase [Martelella soudanensis]|uniref:5-formyl-3-hydroxy-2-methylpyridine 4-carboxylate 5-dehydrogenase n=1 Tax=unclassified Martelella TaxID=2629616 RepID=UPI0015DF88B1|nr:MULTISPECIES: 5-formyl-3-hydroxy-2-methylpyridine 4-carboxylate 5-dehydrogenase [unclassified Martelella]